MGDAAEQCEDAERRGCRVGPNPLVRINRIDQSPTNVLRWCLELACGHEAWVTARRRPQRSTCRCPQCDQRREEQNG
jgi:hypothetical protein